MPCIPLSDQDDRYFRLAKVMRRTALHLKKEQICTTPVALDTAFQVFLNQALTDGYLADVVRTLTYHLRCQDADIQSGRHYWRYVQAGRVVGLAGYQCRQWDPPQVVWGGWFLSDKNASSSSKIGMLLTTLVTLSEHTTHTTLYIEVFADASRTNILGIYRSLMLEEIARLPGYYAKGQDMVIMRLDLAALRAHWFAAKSESRSL